MARISRLDHNEVTPQIAALYDKTFSARGNASHTILARNLGWNDDQLAHLEDWPQREDFTAAEKAALHLAETVTRDAHSLGDEQFSELRGFYSEGEIVELLCAIGLFNYFNRFNNALQMEPTKPGEGGCARSAAEATAATA